MHHDCFDWNLPTRCRYVIIDDIKIPEGHRDVDPKKVDALAESMSVIGLLHRPVVTYEHHGDEFIPVAVAGVHRILAARKLGWKNIEAINAVELNDLQRELIEIDENLYRHELSPAEQSSALARRKAIYEELHPETKHGSVDGKERDEKGRIQSRQNGETGAERFTKDAAAKTGMSERTVQREVARAEKIGQENLRKVAGTSLDKPGELDALASVNADERDDLINRAAAGETVSAKAKISIRKSWSPAEVALRERATALGYDLKKRGGGGSERFAIVDSYGGVVWGPYRIDTLNSILDRHTDASAEPNTQTPEELRAELAEARVLISGMSAELEHITDPTDSDDIAWHEAMTEMEKLSDHNEELRAEIDRLKKLPSDDPADTLAPLQPSDDADAQDDDESLSAFDNGRFIALEIQTRELIKTLADSSSAVRELWASRYFQRLERLAAEIGKRTHAETAAAVAAA